MHITKGRVKNGNVTGFHYYDPSKIRILEEEAFDEKSGVFKAKIEFYDKNTNKWITKKTSSTFFPKNWTPTKLFNECYYANCNKVKKPNKDNVYISRTLSGISVEIIIIDENLISIYPIIDTNYISIN